MGVKLAKEKPKWLAKIHGDNVAAANKAFEGRCRFVIAYLEFCEQIEDLNEKYGTSFTTEDIFEITEEDEQKALDMEEGSDDDDDD